MSCRTWREPVIAAAGVSLTVQPGEILGIVGESGCGKTSLARTALGIQAESGGTIRFQGQIVSGMVASQARKVRRDIQYVHQDPGAALDPWRSIGSILHEGLKIHGVTDAKERDERIDAVLAAVGLDASAKRKYAHEFSGGQLRRVGLARILALRPQVVVLDEPTAGLDMSVQAAVLNLLRDLRDQFELTYIFISHDLSVVEKMCDRVTIMYLGRVVEIGTSAEIFACPVHPYTKALLSASLDLEPGQAIENTRIIKGDPPSPRNRPSGCAFRTRCPVAVDACAQEVPIRRGARVRSATRSRIAERGNVRAEAALSLSFRRDDGRGMGRRDRLAPNALPVISPVAQLPGFYLTMGFSGHGLGAGPAGGHLAADLSLGRMPLIDPTPFRLERMSGGERLVSKSKL